MRYVHLPGAAVDVALLEDATRRGGLNLEMGAKRFQELTAVVVI